MEKTLADLFPIDDDHPSIDGSDIEIKMGVPAQLLVEIPNMMVVGRIEDMDDD